MEIELFGEKGEKCHNPRCNQKSTNHCGYCSVARYCSRKCQIEDWKVHYKVCDLIAKCRDTSMDIIEEIEDKSLYASTVLRIIVVALLRNLPKKTTNKYYNLLKGRKKLEHKLINPYKSRMVSWLKRKKVVLEDSIAMCVNVFIKIIEYHMSEEDRLESKRMETKRLAIEGMIKDHLKRKEESDRAFRELLDEEESKHPQISGPSRRKKRKRKRKNQNRIQQQQQQRGHQHREEFEDEQVRGIRSQEQVKERNHSHQKSNLFVSQFDVITEEEQEMFLMLQRDLEQGMAEKFLDKQEKEEREKEKKKKKQKKRKKKNKKKKKEEESLQQNYRYQRPSSNRKRNVERNLGLYNFEDEEDEGEEDEVINYRSHLNERKNKKYSLKKGVPPLPKKHHHQHQHQKKRVNQRNRKNQNHKNKNHQNQRNKKRKKKDQQPQRSDNPFQEPKEIGCRLGYDELLEKCESLEKKNEIMEDILICSVCLENRKEEVITDCGHVFCSACCKKLSRCPMCRSRITGRIRMYL